MLTSFKSITSSFSLSASISLADILKTIFLFKSITSKDDVHKCINKAFCPTNKERQKGDKHLKPFDDLHYIQTFYCMNLQTKQQSCDFEYAPSGKGKYQFQEIICHRNYEYHEW